MITDSICSICGNEAGIVSTVRQFFGTCTACRELSHDCCEQCGNYAIPKIAGSTCLFCAHFKNGQELSYECPCGIARVECTYHKLPVAI
jgi:hypothetical protein